MVPIFEMMRGPQRSLIAKFGQSQIRAFQTSNDDLPGDRTMFAEADDAFLLIYQVGEMPTHEFWAGCKLERVPAGPRSIMHIIDMSVASRARIPGPFQSVNIHIPRVALNAFAEDIGAPPIAALRTAAPWSTIDPIVDGIHRGIVHALNEADNPLLSDHLLRALLGHVAVTYGGLQPKRTPSVGGLAPWQERRATELLAANILKEMSLADLAVECELSVSHFSRAFKVSTGLSPQRWLQRRRVELAKDLLNDPELALAAVGARCGFADQSHFTRIFARVEGTTPGAWRRLRRAP